MVLLIWWFYDREWGLIMGMVYLNGEYFGVDEVKILLMDCGFLFGDGIYEVILLYYGKMFGFGVYIECMNNGLNEFEIKFDYIVDMWCKICNDLCEKN